MPEQTRLMETEWGRAYSTSEGLYPSVSAVLRATQPTETARALEEWANRIGPQQAQAVKAEASDRGTTLHALVEHHLRGESPDVNERMAGWWHSLQPVLGRIKSSLHIESSVAHSELSYAGTLDLICQFDAVAATDSEEDEEDAVKSTRLTLVDWKSASSPRSRSWLGDYPLQLAAYAAAARASHGVRVEQALLVVALDGQPAQVFRFDRQMLGVHWQAWQGRLWQFWKLFPNHPQAENGLRALEARGVGRVQ